MKLATALTVAAVAAASFAATEVVAQQNPTQLR